MAINPSVPFNGAAVAGLTSPTYTVSTDVAPNSTSKQYAVTALGGTQTGVDVSSGSRPFTVTYDRGAAPKQVSAPNPSTGVVQVPFNVQTLRFRKGLTPLAGQTSRTGMIEVKISIPAGADLADAVNIKALMSCASGFITNQTQGIVDSLLTGVI